MLAITSGAGARNGGNRVGDALGDGAEETKQCLQSLMGLKQRIKQAES